MTRNAVARRHRIREGMMTGASARLSYRQIQLRLALTVGVITVATVGFLILFLGPVLEITPEQLRFIVWELVVVVPITCPFTYLAQKRLAGHILEYVERRPQGTVTPELRRAALAQTLQLPVDMFKFTLPSYPVGGLLLGGIAVLRFEAWGAMALTMMVVASFATGVITQILAFLAYKLSLEPVRAVLAREIDDPDVRMQVATVLPVGRKLFVLISALTLCTAYFSLSLAFGHASAIIEDNALAPHPTLLREVADRLSAAPDRETALRALREVYVPAGVILSLLDPAETESETSAEERGLTQREVRHILGNHEHLTALEVANSARYDSANSYSWLVLPESGELLVASTPKEIVDTNLDSVGAKIGAAAIFVILVAMVIAWLASREIHQAVTTLRKNIQRIASGDLTEGERFESEDEMGELARLLDRMTVSLREIVQDVATAAAGIEQSSQALATANTDVATATRDQVAHIRQVSATMEGISAQSAGISESAVALGSSIDESSSSAVELSAMGSQLDGSASVLSERAEESSRSTLGLIESIRDVGGRLDDLAGNVQDAARSMEAMVSAAGAVEGSANETAHLAESVRNASETGRARVRETIQGMEEIREATEAAQLIIRGLEARTQAIGKILTVIDNVADETKLLSLNAAIIAAQSGEQGRAFAVVADEIKGLAQRVISSTGEISEVIRDLQEEGANAVGAVDRGVERVLSGVELSAEAGRSLEETARAAHETDKQIDQITAAISRQGEATEQVVGVIEKILRSFESIQQVGEEQGRQSDHVMRNAADVGDVAKQVDHTAREQAQATQRISENIENVRSSVTRIKDALREQTDASARVSESMDSILSRTRANEQSVEQMDTVTEELLQRADSLREKIQNFKL